MFKIKKLSPQQAAWLFTQDVQSLLAVLSTNGEAARVVGGAIRNTLLKKSIDDIDIATTCSPQEIMRRATEAGFHVIPTGIAFGTLTIIINHRPFEVTSLRTDMSSNGRHAVVAFGKDWHEDAKRRDFTINALYCDSEGTIYDDVGAMEDIQTCRIRFIGEADARIEEDYLRILRFFRFFAYYGKGRPDSTALKAIVRQREGLKKLSSERIWSELKKLLNAPDCHRALLWMRMGGILSLLLPESEKWGIDLTYGLIQAEKKCGFPPDPLLRLESMIPANMQSISSLASRLKLAGKEKKRLVEWANLAPIKVDISVKSLKKTLYLTGKQSVTDKVKLELGRCFLKLPADLCPEFASYHALLVHYIEDWHPPIFPLKGRDLLAHGYKGGPEIGRILNQLEAKWIDSDFSLSGDELLEQLSRKV